MNLEGIERYKAFELFILMVYPNQAKKMGFEDDVDVVREILYVGDQIIAERDALRWKQ